MKQREIKFRAWDKRLKLMFINASSGVFAEIPNEDYFTPFGELNNSDRFCLMQYTGLKDKNGKEIYEGDILRHYDEDGFFYTKVFFEDGRWVESSGIDFIDGSYIEDKDGEIVGNIYENPELLK